MVVMHELKIRRALTTDRHFQQMGFQVVPDRRARRTR
jgi:predicted nucleic acid-binding protein